MAKAEYSFTAVLDWSGPKWAVLLGDDGSWWPLPRETLGKIGEGAVLRVTLILEEDHSELVRRKEVVSRLFSALLQ
ncbi:MAG: hypothetical protein H0Z38_05165 [Firmicutes bacterium]|nr:hypothetical protein [Bacillota bacterium]